MAHIPYKSAAEVFRSFLKMLRVDRKDISAIYLFAILAGLVQLSLPLGIQTIISFVLAGSLSTSIVILIVLVVTGTFLNGLLQVRQLQLIEKLKQKIFVRFSLEFADRLPALNVEKLDHVHLPEMVNRFFEVPSFQKGIEKILLDIPTALIQMVLGLLLLSFYHPVFIAFGAVLLLIIIIILRYTVQPGFSASLEASDYKYRVAAWLQEIARMIKSFKYARNSAIHIRKTDDMVIGYLNARTHYFKILLTQAWGLIGFKTIITAAMLIVGATLLVDQQINIGQFIAADIVILAIIGSVEKLIGNLDVVYETFTSIEKMNAVIEAEKEKEGSLLLANQENGVAVSFENVSFNYSNDEPVLKNISCTIQPGELVLLKGPSGSGKSSFLRLLTAAFNSFDGNVLIDGLPIGNYQLESLRAKTGVLIHQQDIFRGSLLENITIGNPAISLAAVQDLSTKTGLAPFIQSNKEGYDTLLDPLGKRLPQNIRQLILLNRALLGNYRLLLLEQPFMHLTATQKSNVLLYIKNEKQATTIIISEEEITSSFDRVIELKEGSIQL
jgi:ABC-type bacteriocin/lantibiotic exporter with double-glycine peptidase domain